MDLRNPPQISDRDTYLHTSPVFITSHTIYFIHNEALFLTLQFFFCLPFTTKEGLDITIVKIFCYHCVQTFLISCITSIEF